MSTSTLYLKKASKEESAPSLYFFFYLFKYSIVSRNAVVMAYTFICHITISFPHFHLSDIIHIGLIICLCVHVRNYKRNGTIEKLSHLTRDRYTMYKHHVRRLFLLLNEISLYITEVIYYKTFITNTQIASPQKLYIEIHIL